MSRPGKAVLLDSIKGGAMTLALFLAYVTFPVFGLLPGLFTPLPALYCYVRHGAACAGSVVAITVMVLAVMADGTVPLLYILQCGIVSLLLPYFYLQEGSAAKAIGYASGIAFAAMLLLAAVYSLVSGADLPGLVTRGIDTSISQALTIYEKQGLTGEDYTTLADGMRQAGALIGRMFPALLLVGIGSIGALNLMTLLRLPERLLTGVPRPAPFASFKNPDPLVWVLIAAGFTMLLPVLQARTIALNVLVVLCFCYFLQGLAVVMASFNRFAVPGLVRAVFWLVLAFQPYLVVALSLLGIFDIWGDFRSPRIKNL
jgi:uncharacterized protein YybS (DUF2232 family)